ncbi:N-terminal region of Chorein, a TM vesicle-mediated sorter, putative [Leishmania donovani]|uniref:N-terminal region of Chorein, a TM vesicle-mediated sorter, putative n=1 Tax=Leishmania donovani TaxID=5661 RepID=A0A3S7WQS1_LEIDO|nr:N-terminal region of Chorein, a TM vesicle-mediated sorter, putative [Leishmania donovani]
MVFAGYIAFILSTYLGKFIKGVNKDSVNVSLLRGSIELKKLELLPDLLYFCEHLQLVSGTIGSLSVKIPWHFLYSKRCEVVVRDVSITVAPKHQHSDTATAFFRSKEEFLTAVQVVVVDATKQKKKKYSKSGLLNRLQQTFLKNLAFHLENLSFQLEDKTGCWKGQTARVQARFGRLTCEATDSNYKSTFVQPEDSIANESLYRLVSYEGVSVRLLYSFKDEEPLQRRSSQLQNLESVDSFINAEEVLVSSEGAMAIYLQKRSATVQTEPRVWAALMTRKTTLQWSAPCTTAIGILLESVKQAPRRAFFWDNRPASRIRVGDPAGTSRWWSYAIGKVVTYQKARRDRRRFDWAAYQRRKLFLASLFTFCLQLLQAPWIPDSEGQSLSEEQLVRISAQDAMACWHAAKECFAQFQRTKRPPQGSAYAQYLQYFYLNEQKSCEEPLLELSPLTALPAEIGLTIECAELAVSLDQNLRGATNQAYIGVTASKDKLCVQLSAATATVVAEADEDKPVLAITGSDTAGVLLMASKVGHSPASVELVIEEMVTCLDLSFQELLVTKVASYIVAARPFLNQDFSDVSNAAVLVGNKVDHPEMRTQQEPFSSFGIIVKSVTGKADGVCLHAKRAQLALALSRPPVAEIQEISAIVNDATLVQLCSVAVTPALGSDGIRIEVVTDSANISTNVEGFEYVKLLLGSMKQQWSSRTNNFVSDLQARRSGDAKQDALSKEKSQVNLALRFEFIEYGALALETFSIRTTFGDGWHIHLSAAGGTTEWWCHSIPPQPQESFIDIHVWAGGFLVYSPFADSIEGNGIAFTCNFNHVTVCLGNDLISSLESLYDTVMMILCDDEDRHVYLSERDKYTAPQIIGLFTGSHMMLLLDSKSGDLTLLPGHTDTEAAAAAKAAAGSADFRRPGANPPPTPPPLTLELLGEECLHVSLQRYGDKRMDIHVALQRGVNAYLIGAPAHIPLFVPRDSMRAEVELHMCAPSDVDLPIFPYGRLNVVMKLSNVGTVMHIPTLTAVWTYFDTPSLPLCRLRNIGSRLLFSSRPSQPGATLAPRSPASASVEAVGAAAFARISRPSGGGARSASAPLSTLAPFGMYSTPVFPSDMRLSVEISESELYYPWGEGSVAPLYLHAELTNCEVVMLSRDGCVEVTVRGFLAMPRVRAALHTFPRAMSETTAQCAEASTTRTAAESRDEHGTYEKAPPWRTSEEHTARPCSSQSASSTAQQTSRGARAAHSPAAAQAAFPSEEYLAAPQHCASPPLASSLIQVHVVYTMDSRPPFSPESPDESLRVSLTATAVPGIGALPGPLHASLRSPAEVAAWLTFFTFFNLTNTVPLSTSSCVATASPTFVSAGNSTSGGSGGSIPTAAAQNPRRLIMNVHTSPIVFHLPFAAAAAVLWEGLDFVASPGYSVLRVPKLDVLVHEQLWCTAATGVATSVQRLATLRDNGYAVLSLRSSSSGSIGEVDMMPAILFESHATGPTAAEVRRRLVLPAIVGHLAHATTLVQLQKCFTLAAVSAVFAARNAQTALLNAVILQESQRRKLRYACCCTTSTGGGGSSSYSSGTDADAEAQLLPLISPPLAIHIHSGCLTFEWMSGLQHGLRAGVTVAFANARCNDYDVHNHLSAAQPADDSCDTTAHCPQRFPLALSMPLIVEVEAVEAYVWWANAERTSTAEAAVGEEVASLDGPQSTSKQHPGVPLVTACMPLLLYPFQVHTRIDTAAQVAGTDTGEAAHERGTAAAAASDTCLSVQQEDARVATSEEELVLSFAVSSGDDTIGTAARRSQSLSSATLHTMPSTPSDRSSVTAAAVPTTIMYPMRPAEALPTSVFLVTPIHVVLNNSAYIVLSEMLLHKVQGTSAATAAGAQGAVAEATPPVSQGVAIVSQYYLKHCVVEPPTAARGSATTSSASLSSPFPPLACSRSEPSSYTRSARNGFGGSSGGHASSSLVRAQAVRAKTIYVFRYDSAPKQRVWVESQSQTSWQLDQQQPNGDNSVEKDEERGLKPSRNGAAEIAEVEKRSVPMSHTPLSSLHAMDGMRMLEAPAVHDGPANLRGTRIHEGPSKLSSSSAVQEEKRREPHQHPRPSAHVTMAVPTLSPQAATQPRLQMRITVAEVCLRLVYYRDVETVAAAVSEERAFWQRYAEVHASARRAAAAASPVSATTTQTPCLMTFLAASVAPLRSLYPASTNSITARSRINRSASPLARSRTPLRWGQLPALPASAQQQLLAPTAMLEEACVDALCVRLSGIIVSSFTDARSVQLESCVCTSVKSPSRPLLSTTQVELYVPSSAVAYPSAGEAAKTVTRDLQGAAWVTKVLRGMETAPEAESVGASPTMSPKDTNAIAAPSAPVLPQPQPSDPTRQAERSHLADSPSLAAAPTAASTSVNGWNCNGDGGHRQAIVMQGEVGCRLETLTIDLSAAALRAWLSCLVEQPVAALRAATEKEKRAEPVADRSQHAVAVATTTPILSPVQWKPGQGLRVHEIREAFWELEHDITLSRDGLVLVFSSQETNLLTVYLNGHDITLDPSLLLRPAGLQRVVMVVQGGLTVRFVGSGRVRLPLALWSSSLVETTANVGLETALLPFMAIGEGSYLECPQVRLGFTEPPAESSAGGGNGRETAASSQRPVPDSLAFISKASAAGVKAAEGSEDASVDASPPPPPSSHADPHQSQLVHRNVHLYMPHISAIIEPRRESRQLRIRTAVESWMSLCNGQLLRDDVRCTGFMVLSESIYDAATTTARTTVLGPVDVSVCSSNGRHHAVSLGPVQVDLGRSDLLIMSTYAGELQALRLYAKHLTHSKVERAFLELVEATLAWKASAATTNNTGVHGEEDEHDSELYDGADSSDKSEEKEGGEERRSSGPRGGAAREQTVAAVPPLQTDFARASHTSDASGATASTAAVREGAMTIDRPRSSSTGPRKESHRQPSRPATPQGSATRRTGTTKALLRQFVAEGGEVQEEVRSRICAEDDQMRLIPTVDVRRQQQQQQRQRRRQRLLRRRQPRGFSWVVFTPSVEVIFSDHRYPLMQVCVQDVMVRRTSSSALASTSLVRCQRASVRVHGRGRWDVLLKPSAALTWSLTQTVSRHSSNRHVSLVVEGVHWQCSHLIVAKLLYMNHQFSTLATSLRRRLTMAAAAGGEASSAAAPASVAHVAMAPAVTKFRGEDDSGRDTSSDTTAGSASVSTDGDDGSDSGHSKRGSSSSRQSNASTETFSDTISRRQRRQLRQDAVAMGAGGQSADSSLTMEATPSSLSFAASSVVVNEVPATAVTTAADRLAATMRPSQRGGYRRPSVTAGAGTPVTTAAVSPGMATHRLLNSFSHTLFAGICERVEVAKVSATATPDVLSAATRSADPSSLRSTAETAAPMLWRCNELYRLPPSSTTDIFISYRRAHSLMLTFFTAEFVEWDGVNCAWTLNAKGETALAARAIVSTAKPSPTVPPPRQQKQLDTSRGAVSATTTNWFAFTSLQYGMARALTVSTTASRGAAATPATATGISDYGGGNGNGGGCKVLAYSLALTCVDAEEEADTSRYPIVVASGEGGHDGLTPVPHQQQQHRRHARRRSFTASSADASALLSRSASSMCVGSLKKGGALLGGSTPKGAAPQMARGSSSSSSRAGASHRTSDDFVPAQCGEPLLHRSHDRYDRLQMVQCGAASTHSLPDQRRSSATISTTTGNQKPAAQRSARPHSRNTARVPPAVHRGRLQLPYHVKTATTPMASWQDTEGGGGDLLVVRLQARSSLFNETGCTLQLLPSLQLLTAPNSVDGAPSLPATLTTVPPGWQLPLNEEDVHNEVVLRVCCPSTRWMPSPAAPSATAASSTGMTVSGPTAGVAETMDDATTHLCWYETRTVLGQLQSGRFLSFRRVDLAGDAAGPPVDVAGAATAKDLASSLHRCATSHTRDDHDERLLILFVIHTYSADGLMQHISLYPRLTLINHLGLTARVVVFQQDPLAGPQTPDEATLIAQWTAPRVGRGLHDQERFYRSLVALGAHDALPHQHALPLHFCTYGSNLVLGLSFTQSTGDAFFTADLDPVVTHLRDAVDRHPRLLQLRDSHGRAFYVQVSVMSRTVVLSVALWVYNLTEYPLLMSDGFLQRRLCPGQNSTSGIIPSQGEPFLIGCQIADFTQGFFAIGMDGSWSSAVPIDVGSSGVFVSALSRLGITRSCNYSILFPNAQEGRPMVIQITPRWVFYNNTPKQLRLQFRFPGLETAMQQAEKRRRRLRMREMDARAAENDIEAAAVPFEAAGATLQGARHRLLLEADDTVGALNSIAAVQLNPGDYHVSCIGPIEGNQFRVQEMLQGILPAITSIHAAGRVGHRDVSSYYESQYTPYMDVDRPGEATFNLWAAPRALGKQVAVNYGSDLIVQRPSAPHPTELEPHDMYSADAVITGRIAVAVQSADDVLAVLLQPIQGTKILLQNRTESHTVMARQLGSSRRNRIPPRQNRFFLWEDARQEHTIRVHLLGYKGRWFDVDFSAGECQVTRHVDTEAAAAAEALDHARRLHPHPTQVKLEAELHGRTAAAADFSFHVRGYTNTEKTLVTILVTETPVPVYAAIDSWRTLQAVSLRMTMVQLSWTQEMSTHVATAAKFATPFAIDDGGDGVVDSGASGVAIAPAEGTDRGGDTVTAAPPSSVANAALFSIILEGVQLERLATEDNENFYLAVHQMQWVDEKRKAVFVYRARPRLPPAMAMLQAADAAQGSASVAAPMLRTPRLSSSSPSSLSSPSCAKPNPSDRAGSLTRRRQLHRAGSPAVGTAAAGAKSRDVSSGGYGALLEPITATANRLLSTALGRSNAFLLCMEKQNDLEISYSLIKYADGVTRYTELRHVLTPLVVVLTDFLVVDMIQEVRRLRVLLGLRKQTAASQTTTTSPVVLTVSSLRQQQRSTWRAFGDEDTGSGVMVGVPGKQAFSKPCARPPSWKLGQRSGSVVVVNGDTEADVLPSEQPTLAAQAAPRRRSPNERTSSEDAVQRRGRQTDPLSRRGSRDRSRDGDKSNATAASSVHTRRTGSSHTYDSKAGKMRSATRRLTTTTPTSPRRSGPSCAVIAATAVAVPPQQQHQQGDGNTAGFLSQAFFLQKLVQEVRTRLEQRGTDAMAGSLAALATRGEKQLQPGSGKLLLLPGGIAGAGPQAQHRQLLRGATSAAVRHYQSAMHCGGPGDGLAGVTTVDADGSRAVADVGSSGARAAGDGGVGSVSTASFMFIERLEVQRVTLYVTFVRHSPDPLRPLLGAYAWMLPSQLCQREFYLPAWTLTRQVETPASLRARLVRWGMHSLREQWTKVTKLGTLLDALKFWQHRTLLLHGAPRPLTLSRVQQQQQQERGGGGGQPLATFAPCISSGEEENDENTDDDSGNADPQRGGAQVESPIAFMKQRR